MKKNNLGTGLSLTLAFITGVLGTYLVFMNNPKITKNIVENINKVEISENSIADSVDKVYDAVLAIVSYKNDTQIASGTGFVYKKENKKGYIMTNNHVIDGADKVTVTFSNNNTVEAKVLGKETFSDIAVLTIDEKDVIKVVEIGDSEKLRVGDTLFAYDQQSCH